MGLAKVVRLTGACAAQPAITAAQTNGTARRKKRPTVTPVSFKV
jgi:hypothetical protein